MFVAARAIRSAASTAVVPESYNCTPLRSPGRISVSFSSSFALIGVVKSWQFISVPAAFWTASVIFGWQCPSVVT